jgi:hypothetical protein
MTFLKQPSMNRNHFREMAKRDYGEYFGPHTTTDTATNFFILQVIFLLLSDNYHQYELERSSASFDERVSSKENETNYIRKEDMSPSLDDVFSKIQKRIGQKKKSVSSSEDEDSYSMGSDSSDGSSQVQYCMLFSIYCNLVLWLIQELNFYFMLRAILLFIYTIYTSAI